MITQYFERLKDELLNFRFIKDVFIFEKDDGTALSFSVKPGNMDKLESIIRQELNGLIKYDLGFIEHVRRIKKAKTHEEKEWWYFRVLKPYKESDITKGIEKLTKTLRKYRENQTEQST